MTFDFINTNKKVHFIGIGGISMSGLAEILIENNFLVSGSDMKESPITEKLNKKGAKIYIGHKAENVLNADLVVYTAAISSNNPELIEAKKLNIPLMDRAEFLGNIMKNYKYNIAVSGTHGKTTTTSMISHITLNASLNPTILIGGELDIIDGNVHASNSDYLITEACEYKASFLKFFPYIGVILNIDADHLDYYKNIEEIKDVFLQFAKLIPKDGYLVANGEDENVKSIIPKLKCNVITFGIKEGDITARNISYNEKACANFDVYNKDTFITKINLNVPGEYNILNALASIAATLCLNVSIKDINEGLFNFNGTHRRFEIKGVLNGVTIIDDYAHHPVEIKATLNAVQKYPHNRIFCVFQPHTYSRTLALFDEFTNSFSNINKLILLDIYAAREKDTGVVNSNMLGDSIRQKGINCINIHSFEKAVNYLKENLKDGDILLTLGAGDVYKVGDMYINLK